MLCHSKVLVATCALVLAAEAVALANPASYSYAFDAANYLVAPSTKVHVNVYLKETVGIGETAILGHAGAGLFGAGVKLQFDLPPQPANPAKVLTTLDITANSLFDDLSTTDVSDVSASLAENTTNIIDFVHGAQPDPSKDEYWLLIGTFAFMAGATPGEVTPILATRYSDTASVVITGDGVELDNRIAGTHGAITVVPEPSALALASIASLLIVAFRCWL
jgi:hypothetical protein